MQESHTNVKAQPACFTCNADRRVQKKKKTENKDFEEILDKYIDDNCKHNHSSRRSPIFGGTKQLLLSLILTEIAQCVWKVNNCRILKEAWKHLLPTRILGLNKTSVIHRSLAGVGQIEIWYFYFSGSQLRISNTKRSCLYESLQKQWGTITAAWQMDSGKSVTSHTCTPLLPTTATAPHCCCWCSLSPCL